MSKASTWGPKSKAVSTSLFLRYAGSDKPAAAVAAAAIQRGDLPLTFLPDPAASALQGADYTLVDPTLTVATDADPAAVAPPTPGLSYSGFSPQQRAAYLSWLEHPVTPAPAAYQQLLLANAEVRLLEGDAMAGAAYALLRLLAAAPAWQGNVAMARTMLFAFWLRQDGAALAERSAELRAPAALWSLVLGCQALLGQPLLPEQLPGLAFAWNMPVPTVSPAVLRLRLDSLRTVIGQEPLAHALATLGDAAKAPVPWRCQHRDLRLAFPQPNLRGTLQPLLSDLLAWMDAAEESAGAPPPDAENSTGKLPAAGAPSAPSAKAKSRKDQSAPATELEKAHIIVEFGASRSDVFAYVLRQAQKQPGFQQLMDENRHIVYRVPFRRTEMRRFWHLWDYVQGWATTRVYCDGRQLDKWQIYPYSQYLR